LSAASPSWSAYDIRAKLQAYFERGFASTQTQGNRLKALLGHKPRTYQAHAEELAKVWATLTRAPSLAGRTRQFT
jgi:hypothetical protein